MIPAGLATNLAAWADGKPERVEQLTAERDAVVSRMLNTGKAVTSLSSATSNGKSFNFLESLSQAEKLTVLTDALRILGALPATSAPVTCTYGYFDRIQR